MARKRNRGWQREQYTKLMELFRYAAETGYLKGYVPLEPYKSPPDTWLNEQLPILVGVAQQAVTLPFFTMQQAASWLGIPYRTLRWHVLQKKDLPAHKPSEK